jgi:glycosyltransferase involved in cell wall biosynthesis
MIEQPLISIITVVYNGEKYLQQTIDSVVNQTYDNIEYIIVDGASSDRTLEIIKKNTNKITKWVSEPDKGLYDAMNKGYQMASGELVGTINSDDWYEKNAVQTIVNTYLECPDKKVFHGDKNCIEINGNTHVKKARTSTFLFKYHAMVFNHPTMFIHKDIYKNQKYNINLSSLADYQYALEVYYADKTAFYYIPQVISNFRLGGISGNLSLWQSIKENYIARQKAGMSFIERNFAVVFRLVFIVLKKSHII